VECCKIALLFVGGLQGYEAVDWERLIADIGHLTQPSVDGEPAPVLLVEGIMILNYRFSLNYLLITTHISRMAPML